MLSLTNLVIPWSKLLWIHKSKTSDVNILIVSFSKKERQNDLGKKSLLFDLTMVYGKLIILFV